MIAKTYLLAVLLILILVICLKLYLDSFGHVPKQLNTILVPTTELQLDNIPLAVNGSIFAAQNASKGYLMAFRHNINQYADNYKTEIGIAVLEPEFKIAATHMLDLDSKYKFKTSRSSQAQDPRLFALNNNMYMIFNDAVNATLKRSLFIARLEFASNIPQIAEITSLVYVPQQHMDQKNWVPLVYNNELFFVYSFDPLLILHWQQDTKQLSNLQQVSSGLQNIWPYGSIRGGTPAVFVKDLDGYLSFFHSSLPFKRGEPAWEQRKEPYWRIYYMGAVLLDSKPPFKIKAITEIPLGYDGIYAEQNVNYHVIFPTGLVERGDDFLVSAGVQDKKTVIFTVKKQDLYSVLKHQIFKI